MELNGNLLSSWQRGRRLYAIQRQFRYRRWHPTNLLSTALRRAVISLSNGEPIDTVSNTAVNYFLANVKQPGMDVPTGTNTYTLAMDFTATIRNVLEYLSRLTLLTLQPRRAVQVMDGLTWSFLAYEDESGVLHRWKFVDYIDTDTIVKEMHSWPVIGDVIVGRAPMMLHIVSVGMTRQSRRITPWCRAYKSPAIAHLYRFQKRSGRALEGDWKPVWFADNPKSKSSDWVDLMLEDDVAEGLIQHVQINEPNQIHADNFYRDLSYEYHQILASDVESTNFDPLTLPMCRTSCDVPFTCPHQYVCYSTELTMQNSGLYDPIPRKQDKTVGTVGMVGVKN